MRHRLANVLKIFFIMTLVLSLGCFFAACGGDKYTVTVVNGTGGGEYEKNTDVTVTATVPEGQLFEKWTSDGEDVSTDNPYTFKVTKDITLTAVFTVNSPLEEYTSTLYVEDGEDFVILNFTDFQLHDGKSTYTAFAIIDELVESVQPDLITVLGDTAEDSGTFDTTTNFVAVVNHIDALGIPWAPIYGNHDNDDYYEQNSIKSVTSTWINNVFTSAENCVFKVGPDSVTGNGNYVVNVVNRSTHEIVKSLIFVDSGKDGVDSTHVAFYENAIDDYEAVNGGNVPESIVYLHIPLPEYTTLYNSGNYQGIAGEAPSSNGTTAFFAKIKELGSTTHVMCGHDHTNSFYGEYQGVYLMYCLKSSDGDYYNVDQLGGTTFTIGDETTFEYHFVQVTAMEIFAKTDVAFSRMNLEYVENFKYSGKALTFAYKARNNDANVGNDVQFTIWGGDSNWGKRITQLISINVVNNTASVGTVEALDDGWYKVTIDCTDMPINFGENATGYETARLIYFNVVNHAFLIDGIAFVEGKEAERVYSVNVKYGTGTGYYKEGDEATVTANEIEGSTFVEWQVGGVRVSTDNPYTFEVIGNVKLTAVYDPPIVETKTYLEPGFDIELPDYDPATAGTLEFDVYASDNGSPYTEVKFKLVDDDGNYFGRYTVSYVGLNKGYNHAGVESTKIASQTYHIVMDLTMLSGGSATAPGKLVAIADYDSSTLGTSWIDNIEFKSANKCTVTVVGGEGSGIYNEGSKVTVTATVPSDKSFVEWQIDGVQVSRINKYTFTVTDDVTITAVFGNPGEGSGIYALEAYYEIDLPDYDATQDAWLEFDLKIESTGDYNKCWMRLAQDSSNYYGAYKFTRSGVGSDYDEHDANIDAIKVTSNDGDGLLHVVIALHELETKHGNPTKVVKITDHGNWTTGVVGYVADIVITNVNPLS